ncbi:MAG: ATP-binding protein [Prochloraceae cyanobacterium]
MSMKFYHSLKFQLPFFVLLGVIPIVTLAIFLAGSIAKKSMQSKTEEIIDLETKLIASTVNKWDKINVLALKNLREQPDIVTMQPDRQKLILTKLVDNYNHLYRAMTFDTEGWNVARNDSNDLKYYGDRKYFTGPMSGEDITYQSLLGRTSKKLAVCMGTKVVNSQVKVVGVTVICSSLKQMTEELGDLKFGKTGYVMLVDRQGNVLAHPNPAYQLGKDLKNLSNYPPVKNLLVGGESHFSYLEAGKEWISQSTRLNNGWGVVVVMEKAEFLGDEHYFIELMLIFSAISIILLGLFIWFLTVRAIAPISDLTDKAIEVSKGNLDCQIEVKRQDELGILANSFNLMTEQLRSQLSHLESIVKQRTESLNEAHQKTQIALKQARESDRAKDNFLLKITHELKTPLNAIVGYSQQILEGNSRERRINVINQSGLHLLAMLDDIFHFNKLKNESLKLDFKTVNLHLLCRSVVDMVFLEGQKKNVSVKLSSLDGIPQFIKTDEKRLRQVLINLLSNGVKFTDRGQVTLKLTAINSDNSADNYCSLQFEVIDTGIGISREHKPKIFAPFFQIESAGGTGLGLNISQQIISAMGGKISVESELGKGSKFEFKLTVEKINIPDLPRISVNIKGYIGKKRKILLVDDILEVRLIIKSMLVPLGFEIIEAHHGKEGRELLETHEDIDLIFTDVLMPLKSGLTMIFQIKEISKYKNIPIVVISASVSENMQQNCLNNGCDAFLAKPIDRSKLLFTLEKLLDLKWIQESQPLEANSRKLVFKKETITENEKQTA